MTRKGPPHITMAMDNGTGSNIEFKQPSEATKVVEVWQDPIGSSTK